MTENSENRFEPMKHYPENRFEPSDENSENRFELMTLPRKSIRTNESTLKIDLN